MKNSSLKVSSQRRNVSYPSPCDKCGEDVDVKEDKTNSKTRKRREELSVSAVKSIKKENVEVVVKFN